MASMIPAGVGILTGGLSKLFNRGAQKKKDKESKKALGAQATRGEEVRSGKAGAGASLLRGIGSAKAYGGRITNPFQSWTDNPQLLESLTRRQTDPELQSQLTPSMIEGSSGRPGESFLGGLLGGISKFAGQMDPTAMGGGGQPGGYNAVPSNAPSIEEMLAQITKRGNPFKPV